jgi:hypothetical protein
MAKNMLVEKIKENYAAGQNLFRRQSVGILLERITHLEEAAQQSFPADETTRLRDLLWVSCLCGACGHSYKYNRADDPKGEKGHEEHLLAYPDCPSSRR